MEELRFEGGPNIAIKIPAPAYEKTIHFYRDILLLETEEKILDHPTITKTTKVKFGENTLWLDYMESITAPMIWLEINSNEIEIAAQYFQINDIPIQDDLEKIPKGTHWIKDPAGNVFILRKKDN